MISLSSKRKLPRDFSFQPADVEDTLAAAQTCSNSTFPQRKFTQKVITIFFRHWRQSMEGVVLNSLEFTPASTSPASSLVVWVKMDAKVWELWF